MPADFAQDVLDQLAPMLFPEQANALTTLVQAYGLPFQLVEQWASDTDNDEVGWSLLVDVNRCPDEALPWLAQLVGVTLPGGISTSDQRLLIAGTTNFKRGTAGALKAAPAPFLTGTKTVVFRERYNPAAPAVDSPGYLYVITYTSETTDPLVIAEALMSQKPGGIILNYVVHSGQDYTSLRTNYASYSAVKAAYMTYQGLKIDQPGT